MTEDPEERGPLLSKYGISYGVEHGRPSRPFPPPERSLTATLLIVNVFLYLS